MLTPPYPAHSPGRLCHNWGNAMFVILNPSPVILSPSPFVTLSEAKGLAFWLRVNSAKNLDSWLRVNSVKNLIIPTESIIEILRLSPQNDITTQSLKGEEGGLWENGFSNV